MKYRDNKAIHRLCDLNYEVEGDVTEVISTLQEKIQYYSQPTKCRECYIDLNIDATDNVQSYGMYCYSHFKQTQRIVSFSKLYTEWGTRDYEDTRCLYLMGERDLLPEEKEAIKIIENRAKERADTRKLAEFERLKKELGK